jgi:hypothetical protein
VVRSSTTVQALVEIETLVAEWVCEEGAHPRLVVVGDPVIAVQ